MYVLARYNIERILFRGCKDVKDSLLKVGSFRL